MKRSFKYRFRPTPEQADQLNRTFGCVRLVYNKALEERPRVYVTESRSMTYAQSSAALTTWKKTDDLRFLNEVSCVPLQQSLRHLQSAYVAFFAKRSRHPSFKSKRKSRVSAEYSRSGFTLPPADRMVGMDAGITTLAALSTGEKIVNPRHERAGRRKLVKAQRVLSRKLKGASNRAKARLRVARIHARIADRRRDHLHKLSTRLVRENQTVVIEDLSVRTMVKNHNLARAISDAAWSEFRSMLEYKAGRTVVAVDRWFPSSKLCSDCGHLVESLPFGVLEWTCRCGAVHDRDVNAARNILAAGLAER